MHAIRGDSDSWDAFVGSAVVVWATKASPVVQNVREVALPDGLTWRPVRRIGTFEGATNQIGLRVVARDGYRLHLPIESRLEGRWLSELERRPTVHWLATQPFLLKWEHQGRGMWHVPDILAAGDDVLVCDVKPSDAMDARPATHLAMELTRLSLALVGWRFEHLAEMSKQRSLNVDALSPHRWPNEALKGQVAAAAGARANRLDGVVRDAGGGPHGVAATLHILASGRAAVDLDQPIGPLSTVTWTVQR